MRKACLHIPTRPFHFKSNFFFLSGHFLPSHIPLRSYSCYSPALSILSKEYSPNSASPKRLPAITLFIPLGVLLLYYCFISVFVFALQLFYSVSFLLFSSVSGKAKSEFKKVYGQPRNYQHTSLKNQQSRSIVNMLQMMKFHSCSNQETLFSLQNCHQN